MTGFRRHYEKHFLTYEFALSIAATLAITGVIRFVTGSGKLLMALNGNHQVLYSTVASISGSMLGFILSAVSIILVFGQMPQLEVLKASRHYRTVFHIYFQTIYWLAVATAWALGSMLMDTDSHPRLAVTYAMLWLVLLCSVRLYRCVWILRQVTAIAVGSEAREMN